MAKDDHIPVGPNRPANSPEQRENQLVAMAQSLVERRMRDGSASAQETVHFLKLATEKHRLEQEKIRMENELIKAKIEQYESAEMLVGLIEEVKDSLKTYQGRED